MRDDEVSRLQQNTHLKEGADWPSVGESRSIRVRKLDERLHQYTHGRQHANSPVLELRYTPPVERSLGTGWTKSVADANSITRGPRTMYQETIVVEGGGAVRGSRRYIGEDGGDMLTFASHGVFTRATNEY